MRILIAALFIASLILFGTSIVTRPSRPVAAATFTVDATKRGVAVPATASGMGIAMWDAHLTDAAIPGLLAGTDLVRFPGGSLADEYHWQTNSLTPHSGTYINPKNSFPAFMSKTLPAGGQALVTVNYGTNSAGTGGGDPTEAAAWVKAAPQVAYWEIGNEVYGNGYYGNHWEGDLHCLPNCATRKGNASLSPTAYANNAVIYSRDMKAANPAAKIGLVLELPGSTPAGLQPWNQTVLSIACTSADFVIIHWYAQNPGHESDSGLLASPAKIPAMLAGINQATQAACGHVLPVFVTETNSVTYNPGKQTTNMVNGLFAALDAPTWLQAGAQNVDWWLLHNSCAIGNNKNLYGTTPYGDYGALSDGNSCGGYHEPASNTPFPSYYGLKLSQMALANGATFVTVSGNTIPAYATVNGNTLTLVVVNTTLTTQTVTPQVVGFAPTSATVTRYGATQSPPATTSIPVTKMADTLPPYSIAVLTLTH